MSTHMPLTHYDMNTTRDLGDGLMLRWSTVDDIEELVYLNSMVFRDGEDAPPNSNLGNLVRELMSGRHPLMEPRDFVIVEDTRRSEHPIVACTCYWSQAWEYEGITIGLGRPELVATEPTYRNRGLVRAIFEEIHARSEADGHLAQGITGIRYFYRQFGYEYALNLGGRVVTNLSLIPPAKANEPEPYTLRDATERDIPLIVELYNRRRAGSIVSSPLDEGWLRYHLKMWNVVETDDNWHLQIILDQAGTATGFLLMPIVRWGRYVEVFALEVRPETNLQAMLPSLLRALAAQGQLLKARSDAGELSEISFSLGEVHPMYDVLGRVYSTRTYAPYGWYVRVPDLPRFLRHIAPVLERRLAQSPLGRYSGELRITFYRGGLRVVFEEGKLQQVEPWRNSAFGNEDAAFPPLVFLQLLFGHRGLEELRYAYPDVWFKDEAELLVKTLFPMKPSWVLPIG